MKSGYLSNILNVDFVIDTKNLACSSGLALWIVKFFLGNTDIIRHLTKTQ